jgi:hypothetical protein
MKALSDSGHRAQAFGGRAAFRLTVALMTALALRAQVTKDNTDRPVRTSTRNAEAVAVVIGISQYQNSDVPEVDFAVRDAQAVRDVLIQTLGYASSRVFLHTDAVASLAQLKPLIRQELLSKVIPGKSDVFVYYSGHGAPNAETREGFLIPYDYNPAYRPTSDSAYPLREFYADLARLKARSVTVVLDACFSGQSDATQGGGRGMVIKDASPAFIEVQNLAMNLPNGLVITATGPQEIATWDRPHQHGLLTYYLLEGLRGEAADEQGRVTAGRLEQYLKEKVPQAAEELRHRKQMPQVVAVDSNQVLAQLPLSAIKTGRAVVKPAYGSLQITLLLGGELYIDGVNEGTIQAGQVFYEKQITAGPHQVEVRKEGFQAIQEQVVVRPDQLAEKTYNFLPEAPQVEKAYGLIQISSGTGGTLYIDGRKIAELSPYEKYTTGRVEAGPHEVRVEKPGYVAASQQVTVLPDQAATCNLTMRPSTTESAAAPPRPGLVFEDDFRSPRYHVGEWRSCSADYTADGYRLYVLPAGPSDKWVSAICRVSLRSVGWLRPSVRIEFTIVWSLGSSGRNVPTMFSLEFGDPSGEEGVAKSDQGFGFNVLSDGRYMVYQKKPDVTLAPYNSNAAIRTGNGATNRLAVEIQQGSVSCYVNDIYMGGGTISREPSGYIGVRVNGNGSGVLLEHLRVLRLGEASTGN